MDSSNSNSLCFECGLCCNGVIFADGQLRPQDDAGRLRKLGLKLKSSGARAANRKFAQPCAAFDGCRCGIYSERPQYCREFNCALLKSVQHGRVDSATALRLIRIARKRAARVKTLLRQIGDADEHLPLSARFRRTSRRVEAGHATAAVSEIFGKLTLAMHDLNVLLSGKFYPGEAQEPDAI